jgi:hypothetical protein
VPSDTQGMCLDDKREKECLLIIKAAWCWSSSELEGPILGLLSNSDWES